MRHHIGGPSWALATLGVVVWVSGLSVAVADNQKGNAGTADHHKEIAWRGQAPAHREQATLTYAPEVPPAIQRRYPATIVAHLDSSVKTMEIGPGMQYKYWTFNDHVPGPFLRVRVGDTLELHMTNSDASGMPHNIDLHAVTGPGGGATVTTGVKGEVRLARFKMLHPGLFIYHCAAPPVMDHVANGMYGLILVEPEQGLPQVDREFYVLQSEFYADEPEDEDSELYTYSHQDGLDEHPTFIVFNGKVGSLLGENALQAKTGEKVRIFFGNAGPNKISSFHVIGEIFDRVYREGDLIGPSGHSIQTTLVPAGRGGRGRVRVGGARHLHPGGPRDLPDREGGRGVLASRGRPGTGYFPTRWTGRWSARVRGSSLGGVLINSHRDGPRRFYSRGLCYIVRAAQFIVRTDHERGPP